MAKMYVSDPNNELQRSGPVTMLEIFEKEDTVDTWIEPKLTVSWGQTWHEGDYCPNGVSGCTNTALAQIMTYFEYPTQNRYGRGANCYVFFGIYGFVQRTKL